MDLSILRDALLVSLLVMLIFILYKRMIALLDRNNVRSRYPEIDDRIHWHGEKEGTLHLNLPQQTAIEAYIFDEHHHQIIVLIHGELESGDHQIKLDCTTLKDGRYYVKIVSPTQQTSLYFHLPRTS
jgi:hypothetical protein